MPPTKKAIIKDDAPEPKEFLSDNGEYPKAEPLSTVPPMC